ncbi:MAG: enoyl-CoA hydratase/isomerase family protein [Xanthobacteraceae bacterium]
MSAYQNLTQMRVEISNYVAVATMNNPPVNAQSRELQDEISLAFDLMSDDENVRVVVFTGQGKVFSAGADIKARGSMATQPAGQRQHLRSARESYHSIVECKKPVICAINGPALGAGLALVASCDILIASEQAALGMPEIDVGLMGGGRHAMRLFGHSRVRRMAMTGYRVPGPELYRLGVVEACVPAEELMPTAMKFANDIASKAPLAVQLFKQSLNAIEEMSLRDGYRYEQDMTVQIGKTEDSKEAMRAFIEKRKPVFKGR